MQKQSKISNMKTINQKIIFIILSTTFFIGCSNKSDRKEKANSMPSVEFEFAKDKKQLAGYYELDHMKEWYKERVLPPKFDFNIDLSSKTYIELLLLQNEIYARNGYLFMDAAIRGYFNQFKWYQPVFDVPEFKVLLTEEESKFVNKVIKIKEGKFNDQFINQNGLKLINPDFAFNRIQFKKVNDDLIAHLRKMNFAIAPANREQLFYVYDENQYQYIPNFITTDLYLQLLHKYMSSLLQSVERNKLIELVTQVVQELYQASANELKNNQDGQMKGSIAWANTYNAIAYTIITEKRLQVDPSMDQFYSNELDKINQENGLRSEFLNKQLYDYSQFKPVGNYTKDDTVRKYFKCIKWLSTASVSVQEDNQLVSAVLMSIWIAQNPTLQKNFQTFNSIIGSFAGDEDGASLSMLIRILKELNITKSKELSKQTLEKIRARVNALRIDRIKPKPTNQITGQEFSKDEIFFTAGRYTFDAEILIRLVNVLDNKPKRPYPKGLDVFAALGHQEAEDILIRTYKETDSWKEFSDSLALLKNNFMSFNEWNKSIYNKTMDCINSLNLLDERYPLFMQTTYWKRKNLNTSLAAWAELKHDLTLYSEHPYAAEAGEGGGPPPPIHLSYVEPNVNFWKKSIELLNFQIKTLDDVGLIDDETKQLGEDIKERGKFLLAISEKELKGEFLTQDEFRELTWIGGSIEHLTFRTIHTDHLPEREKQIALVADVYSFNGSVLEEAVGLGDEIYVIVEINGYPYLTKGSCFSYYEFTNGSRLTDEEWQEIIARGNTPDRPIWMKELYSNTPSLESKSGYSF